MELNKIFDEFNELYGLAFKNAGDAQAAMHSLIQDEVTELEAEIDKDTLAFVKEAMDVIYITGQQLRVRGVDVDGLLQRVHDSNISKRVTARPEIELQLAQQRYPQAYLAAVSNGFVMRCGETGKVIKPTTYKSAVVDAGVLNQCG